MTIQGNGKHGGTRHKIPFDQAIADEVCSRIAAGLGLEEICEGAHIPGKDTIYKWLAAERLFNDAYARAREYQMESWADDIVRISDDSTNDYMDRQAADGSVERVVDPENVQRSKLRIDTRKWVMSKLARRYADKVDVNVNASVKVDVANLSDAELESRTRAALARLGIEAPDRPLLLGPTNPPAVDRDDAQDGI